MRSATTLNSGIAVTGREAAGGLVSFVAFVVLLTAVLSTRPQQGNHVTKGKTAGAVVPVVPFFTLLKAVPGRTAIRPSPSASQDGHPMRH